MRQRVRRIGGEQRGRVGADSEERDEAEIEQAGQADLQIQAHAHQDVEPDQHQHLADIGTGHRRQQHENEQCDARPRSCARADGRAPAMRAARRRKTEPITSLHSATRMKMVTAPCGLRPSQV